MKKIFILIATLISIQCFGQFNKPLGWGSPNATITIEGLTKPKNLILPVTDTTLSGSQFEGAIVFKTSDKQPYIYNGTSWEPIRRPIQAMWPLYFENDTLKSAIDNTLNRLISVGGYDVTGTNFTVTAPVKWTFDQVVYTRGIDATFNVPLTDPDLVRIDVVYIDSLGNFVRATGTPDSFFAAAPIIPYNAIPVTHINVNNSTIGQAPAPSNSYWSLTGNTGIRPSSQWLGSNDSSVVLKAFNSTNVTFGKDSSYFTKDIVLAPNPATPGSGDKDSRYLRFTGTGNTPGVYQYADIYLDAFGGANQQALVINPRGGITSFRNSTGKALIELSSPTSNEIWGNTSGLKIYTNSTSQGLTLGNNSAQTTGLLLDIYANNKFGASKGSKLLINPRGKTVIGDSAVLGDTAAQLTIKGNIAIQDGTQGSGKVLTSDANGKATWEIPSSPSITLQDVYNENPLEYYNINPGTENLRFGTNSIDGDKSMGVSYQTGPYLSATANDDGRTGSVLVNNIAIPTLVNSKSGNTTYFQLHEDNPYISSLDGSFVQRNINFGINTFSPTAALHVVGNPRIQTDSAKVGYSWIAKDTLGNGEWRDHRIYKSYVFNFNHTGNPEPPTVTVFDNTAGTTVSWSRIGSGLFIGTFSSSILDPGKVWVLTNNISGNPGRIVTLAVKSSSEMELTFKRIDNGTATDIAVENLSLEIRIYP